MEGEETPTDVVEESAAETPEGEAETAEPAAETPAEETPAAPSVLDKLFTGELGDETPEWAAALVEQIGERGEFGVTVEQLAQLDPVGQQLLANIIARTNKAAAQAAQEAAHLSDRERALAEREQRVQSMEADSLAWSQHEQLKSFIEGLKPKGNQPDPTSPEGQRWAVNKLAAEVLEQFVGKIGEVQGLRQQLAAQQSAELDRTKALQAMHAYQEANLADFQNPKLRARMGELMKESGTDERTGLYKMPIQKAHQLALAMELFEQAGADDTARVQKARERVKPAGNAGRAVPKMPVGLNADQQADWLERNPEARTALIEQARRKGLMA